MELEPENMKRRMIKKEYKYLWQRKRARITSWLQQKNENSITFQKMLHKELEKAQSAVIATVTLNDDRRLVTRDFHLQQKIWDKNIAVGIWLSRISMGHCKKKQFQHPF